MNVDVEIYVSQFKTFFKENPNEFHNLIGKGDPEDFFNEVRIQAQKNIDEGEEIELTRKQLIDVVLRINNMGPEETEKVEENLLPFQQHPMGKIWLN
jgi:hypothetical protein